MVVPFVKQLENPDEKYLMDIDTDMSKILRQENLSIDQKLKLYNRALDKFTEHYEPNLFGNSSNALNKIVKPVGQLVKSLEENQDHIRGSIQNMLNKFEENSSHHSNDSNNTYSNQSLNTNSNQSNNTNSNHSLISNDDLTPDNDVKSGTSNNGSNNSFHTTSENQLDISLVPKEGSFNFDSTSFTDQNLWNNIQKHLVQNSVKKPATRQNKKVLLKPGLSYHNRTATLPDDLHNIVINKKVTTIGREGLKLDIKKNQKDKSLALIDKGRNFSGDGKAKNKISINTNDINRSEKKFANKWITNSKSFIK